MYLVVFTGRGWTIPNDEVNDTETRRVFGRGSEGDSNVPPHNAADVSGIAWRTLQLADTYHVRISLLHHRLNKPECVNCCFLSVISNRRLTAAVCDKYPSLEPFLVGKKIWTTLLTENVDRYRSGNPASEVVWKYTVLIIDKANNDDFVIHVFYWYKGIFLPLGTVVGQLCGPHTPTLIVTVGFLYKSLSIISSLVFL